jgi:hypothetical protein
MEPSHSSLITSNSTMREISLHILDIVQNSIGAGAGRIEVLVTADRVSDSLTVRITDDGRGMTSEMVSSVLSPFVTTRTTRRVGLGLPMLAAAAEMCDGDVCVSSALGKGTTVDATFKLSHIDRAPFGDITSTVIDIIAANPGISFRFEEFVDGRSFFLDTNDVQRELGDAPIQAPPVISWLKDYMNEGLALLGGIP